MTPSPKKRSRKKPAKKPRRSKLREEMTMTTRVIHFTRKSSTIWNSGPPESGKFHLCGATAKGGDYRIEFEVSAQEAASIIGFMGEAIAAAIKKERAVHKQLLEVAAGAWREVNAQVSQEAPTP